MRTFTILIAAVVGLTLSPSARADGDPESVDGGTPSHDGGQPDDGGHDSGAPATTPVVPTVILTAEEHQCLAQCRNGTAPVCPPAPACEAKVAQVERKAEKAAMRTAEQLRKAKARAKAIKEKIRREREKEKSCPECVEQLREELAKVLARIGTLETTVGQLATLAEKFPRLESRVVNLAVEMSTIKIAIASQLEDLRKRVDGHDRDIRDLKEQRKLVSVGPKLTFVYLRADNGEQFLGGAAGVEIRWQFARRWWIVGEAALGVSDGKTGSPAFSPLVRGGITREFLDRWSVSAGYVGLWNDLDHELSPKSIFSGGYLGLGIRIADGLHIELDGLLTGRFDEHRAQFAPGFTAGMVFRF